MKKRHIRWIYTVIIAILLIFYGIYMWIQINPPLYLIKGYREFFTDSYFFKDMVEFPGGFSEYIARLFIQFYNYPLIATLLIISCLMTIYFLNTITFKDKKFGWLISFIPVFILLYMHNDYSHSILFDINILALCAALFIFSTLEKYNRILTFFYYTLILAILLYLNGVLIAITFVVTTLLISIPKKEKGGLLVGTFMVFIMFYIIFSLSFHDLNKEYENLANIYSFRYLPLILYASVPTMSMVKMFLPISPETVSRKTVIISFLIIPAVLSLLFFTLNREERQSLQVQHYARNENWKMTLQVARGCEFPDKNMVYYTNEALYHTGRIYNELFSYNQSFGSEGLLIAEISTFSEIVPNQEIFMQLGALSLSIVWGTEAVNVYGANPYVLRNLAKAYLAGGYIREAQKILNLLEHTLFQKDWVKKYRVIANDTTLIGSDPELNRLRKAQTPIAVVSRQNTLMNLFLLSQKTNLNKMAYDYLTIGTLLDHEIENFVFCASRMKEYGYEKIPKLYMEGLVYSSLFAPSLPVDIEEFIYDKTILLRFSDFRNDLSILQRNPNGAKEILKSKYGDTYWYYLIFGSRFSDEERVNILMKMI